MRPTTTPGAPVRRMRVQERPAEIRAAFRRRWADATTEAQRVHATRDLVLAAAKAARAVDPGEVDRLLAGWAHQGETVADALLSLIEVKRPRRRAAA